LRVVRRLALWSTVLAVALVVIVPTWGRSDDSGWWSCGSVLRHDSEMGPGCEHAGRFTRRLILGAAILGVAGVAFAVSMRHSATRRRDTGVLTGSVALVAAAGIPLWRANDDPYVPPTYDLRGLDVTVEPTTFSGAGAQSVRIAVDDWPTQQPFAAVCASTAVPDSCDLVHMAPIVIGRTPGDFDEIEQLTVRTEDRFVVLADHTAWRFKNPIPAAELIAVPISVGADAGR
jgi:hypothetical protein